MIRIISIRHGRTAWNADQGAVTAGDKRFRGAIDLPLANDGISQAQLTAQRLATAPLTAIYSSPLQRAARTGQIVAEPHGLTVQTIPGLGSMDYGDWAGLFTAEVARRWPDLYRQWRQDPFSIQIPGGESAADLRQRVVEAFRTVLSHHAEGDTIALVSHQVVTKTLALVMTGIEARQPGPTAFWRLRQDLCNLSRFDYDPILDRFAVVGLNDTCHLGPELPQAVGGGTRIILIRHGQTAWNASTNSRTVAGGPTSTRECTPVRERFRGRTDLQLDDGGHVQAQKVASRLRREPISALYTSPLLRTRQTIQPLANELTLPAQSHHGLIDIDYGRLQGLTHSQAAAVYPEHHALWQTSPSQVCFPDGEGLTDVQARLLAFLDELVARHPGQTVALAGHQIVNKVLACTLVGLDLDQIWRIQQDTGGFGIFQRVKGDWHTLCLNDVCHLQ
jgi:probable phosphoglycerate mutase